MPNSPRFQSGIFWPSLAFFTVILAIMLAAGFAIIERFNSQANERERSVVANGFGQKINEVQALVVPQVVWDDAVRNLDVRYSPSWAEKNIGEYLNQTYGFDRTIVLDADNRIIFAARAGKAVAPATERALFETAADAIADARVGEASRGAPKSRPGGGMIGQPIQQSQLARIGSHFGVVTATIVQPDFGTVLPRRQQAPVLVSEMDLDADFLRGFAARYMLDGLRLEQLGPVPDDGDLRVVLKTEDEIPVGRIAWHPRNLGSRLLRELFLPAFAMLVLVAAATLRLLRRNQRTMDQLVASEAQAKHLAYYDTLTGLPNRIAFHEQLAIAIAGNSGARRVAIFCLDLDRFKEVNDLHGHHAGDRLICIAAQRFAEICHGAGFVARLSGDEFAILATDTDESAAASIAATLCAAMRDPVELDCGRVFTGCSIGFALIEGDCIECAETLRRADLALYRAKQEGRGRFAIYEPQMDAALIARRDLEVDLRDALATDALTMVYQPQVNRRGEIKGVEALMRWHHPRRGWVSPSMFVPLAEERGLIVDLGTYAFRKVFAETGTWHGTRVAINVSATQLRLHDFVLRLTALVAETGIDPSRYELELTEGILLQENQDILARLVALRDLGFSLVLDDFGTGYSALSYLRKFPIDKIKIDRSFVANIGMDPQADAIVGAIIRLARALRMNVIAEGVETLEQRLRLASTGCWDVQGFLFGQPLNASDVRRMLIGTTPLPEACVA